LFLNSDCVDVLCVTEHWLKNYEVKYHLDNHKIVSSFSRQSAIRGGSLIILHNNLQYKERKDVVTRSIERTIELSCVELSKIIIICVYRPPGGNYPDFESTMEEVLRITCRKNKNVVICGDFNINILDSKLSQLSCRFLNLFKSFNLFPLFVQPTRTTTTSATCLDNIFCNCNVFEKSIINCLKSDHSGQLVSMEHDHVPVSRKIKCRPITKKGLYKFRNNVCRGIEALRVPILEPNLMYNDMFEVVQSEFSKIFKKKTIERKIDRFKFSDWATKGIYTSRRKLYDLYALKNTSSDPSFVEYVRKFSKTFKNVCAVAKSMHIANKIKLAKNKIKTTWDIVNRETCKTQNNINSFSLIVNDRIVNSDDKVASVFEDFFTRAPLEVTCNLNSCPNAAIALLVSSVEKCNEIFNFRHVNSQDIIKMFKEINIKKTEDLWGISTSVIKAIIYEIAPHMAFIFNKCVDDGAFPDLMKCSKLIPLFKSGDKSNPSNFRPISILPALSKIFEKIIYSQLVYFFTINNLFHENQFGFSKGKNTTDAGIALLKHIMGTWENKQDALGVFCDLSKAFDCVDHQTLLKKMGHYGVSRESVSLLQSYLSNRNQKVTVNSATSTGVPIIMGVPQGSILGPLLFLVYINDLPYYANHLCETVLFADDTSLIFKINRGHNCSDDVNSALSKVAHWFEVNNLSLNSNKTKCIKFCLPNVRQIDLNISLDNSLVQLVNSTKFLGITLDSRLQWDPHIEALTSRLSSAAFAVKKIRLLTDIETARLVYFSYFHSVMSYGLLLWGSAANIESVFILQKRAVRAIYNLCQRDSLRNLFKKINILTVAGQYIYDNLVHVKKNIESFIKKSDIHQLNTRNKGKLAIPRFRLQKCRGSFLGKGIDLFNKLPQNLIDLPLHKFKKHVKKILLSKGYYKVEDYLRDRDAWL
jgi:hypothetical protein